MATFVFFHIGNDISIPAMLVHSIRISNPESEIIQCSDYESPLVPGVTRTLRISGNSENIMEFRLKAFASLNLEKPAIYLDTDMLVINPIDLDHYLKDNSILLCERYFGKNNKFPRYQRGLEFSEYTDKPMYQVYPYLACATICRNSNFWDEIHFILKGIDPKFMKWYGDQEAMKIWAKNSGISNYGKISESKFGCLPENIDDVDEISILHFKGPTRKKLMTRLHELISRVPATRI